MNIERKVLELRLYRNAVMYNSNHDKSYKIKKYAEIEFFNGDIAKLDIDSGADITNCTYLQIVDKGKLEKTLFRSNLLD